MENINAILGRESTVLHIKQLLHDFVRDCPNPAVNKGIYIYGAAGCGKTHLVNTILAEMNYDIIRFDAGDVRNSSLIDTITSNSMSSRNVLQMMNKETKKIAIIMDEIDGMNSGDKGGLTALIKLIRQKRTKKQKQENLTVNPIICIGNYMMDKKIKELMKVCHIFELKKPTDRQIAMLLGNDNSDILEYIQGDLRKMRFIQRLQLHNPNMLSSSIIKTVLSRKSKNEDSKRIVQQLINHPISIETHNTSINETDRTIVALLWHENIIDAISKQPNAKSFPFYRKILDNICYADYIDRITFQYQIWQFNEMSSLIKTYHNNRIYHESFPGNQFHLDDVRFTKILTKYSTEYNNLQFIFGMCQELDMDRKDLISFFQELRLKHGSNFHEDVELIERIFEDTEVGKLDVRRMYRYLDKNVKKTAVDEDLIELL
jgi:hypothetical protein